MAMIYVAGSYSRREELARKAQQLETAGHRVTSRWLASNDHLSTGDQVDMDLVDLLSADTVLSFGEPQGNYTTGGRHVEFGYAMAFNDIGDRRRLLFVGWPENIFHHRRGVEHYANFDEALAALCEPTAALEMAAARAKAAAL